MDEIEHKELHEIASAAQDIKVALHLLSRAIDKLDELSTQIAHLNKEDVYGRNSV